MGTGGRGRRDGATGAGGSGSGAARCRRGGAGAHEAAKRGRRPKRGRFPSRGKRRPDSHPRPHPGSSPSSLGASPGAAPQLSPSQRRAHQRRGRGRATPVPFIAPSPLFGCARRKLPQNRFGREMSPSPGWLPLYWGRHGVGSAPRHHVALLALAKGTKTTPQRLQEAPRTPTPRSKATASADPSGGGDAPARTPCSLSWARCLQPPWQRRGILLILLFLLLRPQIGAQPSAAPRARPGPASLSPPAPTRPPLGRPRGSPDVPKGPAPQRIRPYLRSGHRHAAAGTRLGSARQPQRRERGIARLGGQGDGREKKKVREKKRSRTHPLTGKGVVREVANSNEEFRPFLGKPRQGPAALPAAAPCRPRAEGARSGGTGGQCHGHRAARGLRGARWWRRGRAFFLLPPLGCLLSML